jgi:hypothetical protein
MVSGKILYPFLLVLFVTRICHGQDTQPWAGFGIEANYFAGKVLKHNDKFTLPIPQYSSGADINFQQRTYGKKDWQQRRRYPVVGVGVAYTNYGIDAIYGRCYSLYPNIVIPIITGQKLEWTVRLGDGIGYVTRDFSRIAPVDTINVAIGSHLNDYFSFMSDVRYHINDHFDVQTGINFSHISDASFHQPNLGVNLYGAHIGIRYYPATSNPKKIVRDLKPLSNRWLGQFRLTLGYNSSNAPQGPLYPAYIATGYVTKRWLSKNKFMGGLDYAYHTNIYDFLRTNPGFVPIGSEAAHSYRVTAFAGNEFLLGRVGVVFQLGYYLHQDAQVLGIIYEKIGGNLYLVRKETGPVKEFFLCAFLKTHSTVAEMAEVGFGMGF